MHILKFKTYVAIKHEHVGTYYVILFNSTHLYNKIIIKHKNRWNFTKKKKYTKVIYLYNDSLNSQ